MITDEFIDMKNKTGHKVYLMFVDEDKKLCDGCDKRKTCASIDTLGDVMIICKDCLLDMVNCFESDVSCTCKDSCPPDCKGECGCQKCHDNYVDFGH